MRLTEVWERGKRRMDLPAELDQYGPAALNSGKVPLTMLQAQAYCRKLARSHYENFTVASWLVPAKLRQHLANIYAYCRWADDLADEAGSPAEALELLAWWEAQLDEVYLADGPLPRHPVFIALAQTIAEFAIPADPLRDLLVAFRQDQRQTRYASSADLLAYCKHSANPVGRLVLLLGKCSTPQTIALSDSICTGLQLVNFAQDVCRDFQRGRIYLPQDECQQFGWGEEQFARQQSNANFAKLVQLQVERAEGFLRCEGVAGERDLLRMVSPDLRLAVQLFIDGGLAIAAAIRKQQFDVWSQRPTVGRWQKLALVTRAWWKAKEKR